MEEDVAAQSSDYALETEHPSPFSANVFDIDEGIFSDFASQESSALYQERETNEEEILNNYDSLHWPELGKHMTIESKVRHNLSMIDSPEFSDQERIVTFSDEDAQKIKMGCESESKPQTYAAVLQKTLKLENSKGHRRNGSNKQKSESGTMLYGRDRENNNEAVVFGDQKYIFKWNLIDMPSQNIPETLDRKEIEYLTQIYFNFMKSAIEKLPASPQGKEVVEFSSLLMLVGSRIEVHYVDGVSQLYYCLNNDWTEEDSISAHKSYLPHCSSVDVGEETQETQEEDEKIISAKAQAVCTYGFDLNTALTISKDLWGWKRPRMAYTQMFSRDE